MYKTNIINLYIVHAYLLMNIQKYIRLYMIIRIKQNINDELSMIQNLQQKHYNIIYLPIFYDNN
jgi:hypothetical protein